MANPRVIKADKRHLEQYAREQRAAADAVAKEHPKDQSLEAYLAARHQVQDGKQVQATTEERTHHEFVKHSAAQPRVSHLADRSFSDYMKAIHEEAGDVRIDARNLSLRGADLSGGIYDKISFTGSDLSGADLRGTSFKKANLSGVPLDGVKWDTKTFEDTYLDGAKNIPMDAVKHFTRSSPEEVALYIKMKKEVAEKFPEMASAPLPWIGALDFSGYLASVRHVDGGNRTLRSHGDLSGQSLAGMDLSGGNFSGRNFSHTDLSGTDVRGTDFSWADLHGANLKDIKHDSHPFTFAGAVLIGAKNVPPAIAQQVPGPITTYKQLLSKVSVPNSEHFMEIATRIVAEQGNRSLKLGKLGFADAVEQQAFDAIKEKVLARNGTHVMSSVQPKDTSAHETDLSKAIKLEGAVLRKADLSGLDLRGVSCVAADMRGANLDRVKYDNNTFAGAVLIGARNIPDSLTKQLDVITSYTGLAKALRNEGSHYYQQYMNIATSIVEEAANKPLAKVPVTFMERAEESAFKVIQGKVANAAVLKQTQQNGAEAFTQSLARQVLIRGALRAVSGPQSRL